LLQAVRNSNAQSFPLGLQNTHDYNIAAIWALSNSRPNVTLPPKANAFVETESAFVSGEHFTRDATHFEVTKRTLQTKKHRGLGRPGTSRDWVAKVHTPLAHSVLARDGRQVNDSDRNRVEINDPVPHRVIVQHRSKPTSVFDRFNNVIGVHPLPYVFLISPRKHSIAVG
jgi:hypothetical protein